MKRISFDEYDAAHLLELSLEHFCLEKNGCHQCEKLKGRLEKFIGKEATKNVTKCIRENGYCTKLNHE